MYSRPESSDRDDAITVLREFIEAGTYAPGDRLPSERELIGSLAMSRSTLRKALDALEREGTIWRHVGKGTFVGSTDATGGVPELSQQLTPVKMMRARHCIETAIAREAAINASAEALARIRTARDRAVAATTWVEYEAQDDRFHRAIAEATDNIMLLTIFDQLNQVRRAVAWSTVVRETARPSPGHSSFAEHDAITAAIESREPAAAFDAMRKHLGSVSARLFDDA
ncbi:FadR/GntR family transcriptional regulator [Puniceibacterium sp. IMCC21224]|uniref:FadR/GntR family transcriptional regulator n=1 Tax=Puniceibacterium sp. IMCC21224 TaxID=1618204 RepID=UPI00065D08DC|nr:FCD domain-containing protein [Puniceibacterium sp. IMCC21224]KMK65769.1 transcriptional regulator, GntR family [Puniceibacterium sp. IMCC21224]